MNRDFLFSFAGIPSKVIIGEKLPAFPRLEEDFGRAPAGVLLVCDANTLPFAEKMADSRNFPYCVLSPGEKSKTWESVEMVLRAAKEAGLGRDGLFIGIGGGVVTDLAGFAASIYMRGCGLCLVSTSLLGMVDAALGGKTGFDLFGVKNFAGTFFPASLVYLPVETLASLPPPEWKSGMAELIKTAVLADRELFGILASKKIAPADHETLMDCIARAAAVKGGIVEADPLEKGVPARAGAQREFTERALLNLGHSFGHALEASAGLGSLTHGEAVAWGMARACDLGETLGLTPGERAGEIRDILAAYQFEINAPHPLIGNADLFMRALGDDKKKKDGKPSFIVPCGQGARRVSADEIASAAGAPWETVIRNIIYGKKT